MLACCVTDVATYHLSLSSHCMCTVSVQVLSANEVNVREMGRELRLVLTLSLSLTRRERERGEGERPVAGVVGWLVG